MVLLKRVCGFRVVMGENMLWVLPQQEFWCLKGPTKLASSFGKHTIT